MKERTNGGDQTVRVKASASPGPRGRSWVNSHAVRTEGKAETTVSNHYSDLVLEGMMADLESELVEGKESLRPVHPSRDGPIERIRQAVCAFANDLPGHTRPCWGEGAP